MEGHPLAAMAGPPVVGDGRGRYLLSAADVEAAHIAVACIENDQAGRLLRTSRYSVDLIAAALGIGRGGFDHYIAQRRPVPLPRAVRLGRLLRSLSLAELERERAARAGRWEDEELDADGYRMAFEAGRQASREAEVLAERERLAGKARQRRAQRESEASRRQAP